ncbi:MAG TPA: hypothetical protein VI564_09095 [Candidatus Nanoarchaeia archaeon]|nr:hypothetical protein [Candidatus Nanoarchaeia archaeon]
MASAELMMDYNEFLNDPFIVSLIQRQDIPFFITKTAEAYLGNKNKLTKRQLSGSLLDIIDYSISTVEEYAGKGTYKGAALEYNPQLREGLMGPLGYLGISKSNLSRIHQLRDDDSVFDERKVESVKRVLEGAVQIREASRTYVGRNLENLTGEMFCKADMNRTRGYTQFIEENFYTMVVDSLTGEIVHIESSDPNVKTPNPKGTLVLTAKFSKDNKQIIEIYDGQTPIDKVRLFQACQETLNNTKEQYNLLGTATSKIS